MVSKEEHLLPIIKKIRIFQECDEPSLREIAKNLSTQFYTKDCIIFHQGDEADTLYIIQSGKIRIFLAASGTKQEQELAILSSNDFFGEMGLISGQKRNASAMAIEDSILFSLKKENFEHLIETNSLLAGYISKEFMHRIERNLRIKK